MSHPASETIIEHEPQTPTVDPRLAEKDQQIRQLAQSNLLQEKHITVLKDRLAKITQELVESEVTVALLSQQIEMISPATAPQE